ncbi:ribosome hibernation-promoting factor, HPF/YfiA family [Haliovirga abyssi]|uniref:Ribosome hibernation promoting factor n=1 Tax=Haliovirga abyssi TaxID=2996794 RepID=A0AAU9DE30_9FUSO|nr:ribosome-associated translation inhibitor RaiA [Haliovirga abyssi]BDU50582.1 ribosomal subunit interface protein [Haliovirga abyssi]
MRIIISGRHLEITDAIRNYAEKKIGGIKKYFENILEIDITLSVEHSKTEGDKHIADVLLFANGTKIKAVSSDKILYAAIDEVVDVLEVQIKKYKEKLKNRQHHQENIKEIFSKLEPKEDDKMIIKSRLISPKPMSIEEAILQMNSLNQDFYAFMNHETEELNVVYKRKDETYGHIEPSWGK